MTKPSSHSIAGSTPLPEISVLILANNPRQASYRLRIEALAPLMHAAGITWTTRFRPDGVLARRHWLRRAGDYDAVILQRKLLDPSEARLLRRRAQRIYFDVDDAVMLFNRPTGWFSRWRTARRFAATARRVDCVVAGSRSLARLFTSSPATAVIPTTLDPAAYPNKSHQPTDLPALVWIGSASTLPYLESLGPVLGQAAQSIPGLRLITIADQAWKDCPIAQEHHPWSQASETQSLLRGDIGIAPTPDDPWTRGKCGFKILQYMACGLPTLASPIGANCEILREGIDGFLPASPAQWLTRLQTLCGDPALRQRQGQAARRRVAESYSLESAAQAWQLLLRQ